MHENYKVSGMYCAACSSAVEKAVAKIDGVKEVNVSLLTNTLMVEFEGDAKDEAILAAVKKAGYQAQLSGENALIESRREAKANLKKTGTIVITSLVLLVVLMFFGMGTSAMFGYLEKLNIIVNVSIQLVIASLILGLNFGYFTRGFKHLFKGSPNMDSLIAIGSTVSYSYSIYMFIMIIISYVNGAEHSLMHEYIHGIYFEAAAMIVALVRLGKYLEERAKLQTTSSLESLLSLTPEVATVIRDGVEVEVAVSNLVVGDIVVVKPGGVVPVDGVIQTGYGYLDEAALTGEVVPAYKQVGEEVIGGTMNKTGAFTMEVNRLGEDTTLQKIISLVETAAASKAPLANMADRVSGIFVPIVISLALITLLVWLLTGHSVTHSIEMMVSVLVISCPCALGLATPVAMMVGTGKGAENGILLKSATAVETLNKVDAVIFDKTGTITYGHMEVTDYLKFSELGDEHIIPPLVALERLSEHPLGKTLVNRYEIENYQYEQLTNFKNVPGFGVEGTYNKKHYLIGNLAYLEENGVKLNNVKEKAEPLLLEGKTVIYLSVDGELSALFALADKIKPDAIEAISALKNAGKHVYLVSGDNKITASALARHVGIEHVYGEIVPEEKANIVKALQSEGHVVAMVGDGVNDAVALEASDVGVAIGSGTDIAIDSADIVLVRSSLTDLVNAFHLSKKMVNNIKLNLFWAFIYNLIGIPLAAGILYLPLGLKLNPMIASGLMALSSISVVLNALRLKRVKFIANPEVETNKK